MTSRIRTRGGKDDEPRSGRRLFVQKHGAFRRYRIGVIRLGTYRTHVSFLYCGVLCCLGISLFGRRWSTPDIRIGGW